ncbi:hypothetical protein [Bacillus sp. S/N-304-OC-R1]|uniref:hypothetical protein n=1 Tax=Bacillus sp. S/N-304-OC-R1 TaxID=2758034 RepID=UPI001C8EF861|nr:hypothetical protein [Bacillus sp. S/N-304-OC-R1]MBY0121256.1 hypothetical protein [Bacillus sp. S/N-304-OC-R1]
MSILLTLLLIAAFFIFVSMFSIMNLKRKLFTVKVTHWLLIIYVGVLLLSGLYIMLVTKVNVINGEKIENKNDSWDRVSQFHTILYEGRTNELASRQLLKAESYDFNQNLLNIGITGYDKIIYVERKDIDDGKIEARVYTDGIIVSGFDFSQHIKPVNFHMNDDTLKITYPDHQKINISVVRKEFTINQFTGQNPINDINGDGQLAVYLIIPKSLQLHSDVAQFQYVQDKGTVSSSK